MTNHSFFKAGGTLSADCPSYLTRKADGLLFETLSKKEYAYILSSRQMGKSSLIQKTIDRLEKESSIKTICFDLSIAVMSISSEQLYSKLLTNIYKKLNLKLTIRQLKSRFKYNPPHIVFQEIMMNLHHETSDSLIIFLDEIDSLFRKTINPELTINLFSTIRNLYNNRSISKNLNNIVFCMAGVLPPNKLLEDPYSTPYNIGENIQLSYIEKDKFSAYISGFKNFNGDKHSLINQIYYWCNGQPYLTQYICKKIEDENDEDEIGLFSFIESEGLVNHYVQNYILSNNKTETDNTHFSNIQSHIIKGENFNRRAIELYRRVYNNEKIIYDKLNETHEFLKTSGLIYNCNQIVRISNRIYESFFDEKWIDSMENIFKRPFNSEFLNWLKSGKNIKHATLNGEKLDDFIYWTKGRNDITSDEMEFLEQSRSHLEQCRRREVLKIKKRNKIIIFTSIIIFCLISTYNIFQKYIYENNASELKIENKTRIQDFTDILRLLQEKKNPKEIIKRINDFRNKNNDYKPLQIQCFNIISNKIPFDTIQIDKNAFNLKLYNNDNYVYTKKQEIIKGYKNRKIPIVTNDDSIYCFSYNPISNILAYVTGSTLMHIQSSKNSMSVETKNQLTNINTFTNCIFCTSLDSLIYLYENNGILRKKFTFKNSIKSISFNDSSALIVFRNNMCLSYNVYKNIIDTLKFNFKLEDLKFNGVVNDFFYTSDNKNSISYFNKQLQRKTETIQFPNMIKNYIINDKYLIALCFDEKFYFYDLVNKTKFTLNSDVQVKNITDFYYNGNIFNVASIQGFILRYDLSPMDFEEKKLDISGVSAFYKGYGIEVVGNFSGELIFLNRNKSKKLKGHKGGITAIDFSAKYKIIATASYDHTIKLWDLNGNAIDSIISKNGGIMDMKFLNDQYKVIVSCINSNLYLWNLKTHQYQSYQGHTSIVQTFDVTKDSKYMISGARDGTIIKWNIETGDKLKKIKNNSGWITDIEISEKSDYFIYSTDSGIITLRNFDGDSIRSYIGHSDCVWDICFINNGDKFISGSWDDSFCIWDISGNIIKIFKGNSSNISNIIYDKNQKKIYLTFYNGVYRIYNQ